MSIENVKDINDAKTGKVASAKNFIGRHKGKIYTGLTVVTTAALAVYVDRRFLRKAAEAATEAVVNVVDA